MRAADEDVGAPGPTNPALCIKSDRFFTFEASAEFGVVKSERWYTHNIYECIKFTYRLTRLSLFSLLCRLPSYSEKTSTNALIISVLQKTFLFRPFIFSP